MRNKRDYKATILNNVDNKAIAALLKARAALESISAEEAEKLRGREKRNTSKEAASTVKFKISGGKTVSQAVPIEETAWAKAQEVLSARASTAAESRTKKPSKKAKMPRFNLAAAAQTRVIDQALLGGRKLIAKALASGSIEDLETAIAAVKGLGLGEERSARKVLSALKDAEWLASLS